MFGDPYLGLMFKHYLFSQNSSILKDVIIDTIYTQIALFIPQVRVARKDISIVQDREKGKLYCTFRGVNQIDFTNNTYSLLMYDENEIGK